MVWWRICLKEFVPGKDQLQLTGKAEKRGKKRYKYLAFCLLLGNLFSLVWKCGNE
jgi:hypothetical protein